MGHKGGIDLKYVRKLAGQANGLEAQLARALRELQALQEHANQQTTMLGALGVQVREREELLRAVLPGARLAVAEGMISVEQRERIEAIVQQLEKPDAPLARIAASEEREVIGIQFLRELNSPDENPVGALYVVRNGNEQHAAMRRARERQAALEKLETDAKKLVVA